MKNLLKSVVAIIAITSVVGAYGQAKTTKKKSAPAKTMTCPSCHMKMGTMKTKATPVAVKTKNGTFYCCAGCASGKKAAAAAAKKKAK